MANDILSRLNLSEIERELAARRREVQALTKIRAALRRKASFEESEQRLQHQRDRQEGTQS